MQVKINFNDGTKNYDLPVVQSVSDPKEGMKAVVIEGTRGDGSIIIPGGKRSQDIEVNGILLDDDYESITEKMQELKNNITTNVATLTLKHYDEDTSAWVTDWAYTVRRIDPITFGNTMRINKEEYTVSFKVLAY